MGIAVNIVKSVDPRTVVVLVAVVFENLNNGGRLGSGSPPACSQRDRDDFGDKFDHLRSSNKQRPSALSWTTNSIAKEPQTHACLVPRPIRKGANPKHDALASQNPAFTVTISGNAPLMPQSHRRLYRAQGDPAVSTYPKKSASQGQFAQFYQKVREISQK